MNSVGRFGAGFLVGMVLSLVAAAFVGGDEAGPATETTTATAAPDVAVEPWFAPGEVLIGSTVLLPQSLDVDDGVAYFDYDLIGLAPTLFGDGGESGYAMPVGDHVAMPEKWELTTTSGMTVPAETGPSQSSARFELPAGDVEVAKIEIVGWRVPVPFGDVAELSVAEGATAELRRGTVTIDAALLQSISTIVQVDLERTGDKWQADIDLRPVDSHWQVTGGGGVGLQYTWNGSDAPDFIALEDVGYDMRPVVGNILVYDAEVSS